MGVFKVLAFGIIESLYDKVNKKYALRVGLLKKETGGRAKRGDLIARECESVGKCLEE
jgi:hypothetical protein